MIIDFSLFTHRNRISSLLIPSEMPEGGKLSRFWRIGSLLDLVTIWLLNT